LVLCFSEELYRQSEKLVSCNNLGRAQIWLWWWWPWWEI